MPLIVPVASPPAAPAPESPIGAAPSSSNDATPRFADALSRAGQSPSASSGKADAGPTQAVPRQSGASDAGKTQQTSDKAAAPRQTPGQDSASTADTPAAAATATNTAQIGASLEAAMAAAQGGKTLPPDTRKTDHADPAPAVPGPVLAAMLSAPITTQAAAPKTTAALDARALPAMPEGLTQADDSSALRRATSATQGARSAGAEAAAQQVPSWMQGQVNSTDDAAQPSRFASLQRALASSGDTAISSTSLSSRGDSVSSATTPTSPTNPTMTVALPQSVASPQPTFVTTVPTHLSSPDWGQAMNQQVMLAAQGQQQFATLHLNPPQLGPLEVHLQMHDGQIQAQFVSPHAVVRQAVEAALPQLRDLFTGAGLTLSQTSVGTQGGQGERQQARSQRGAPGLADIASVGAPISATAAQTLRWQQGLVNTYV